MTGRRSKEDKRDERGDVCPDCGADWRGESACPGCGLTIEAVAERVATLVPMTKEAHAALHRHRMVDGLQINPTPLVAKPIPVCRFCGMRAPWCSCGRGAYQ